MSGGTGVETSRNCYESAVIVRVIERVRIEKLRYDDVRTATTTMLTASSSHNEF